MNKTMTFKNLIKTRHKFHLVDPSPWPLLAAMGAFMTAGGLVGYMHKYSGGWDLLLTGLFNLTYISYLWGRDIVREATYERQHTVVVQRGIKLGVALFIVAEAMFFFPFFWAFFHSSLNPVHNIGAVWPPAAIVTIDPFKTPVTNTSVLISSGFSITWAHLALKTRCKRIAIIGLLVTLFYASLFTLCQVLEYIHAPFNISDGIYGSCFYMLTGLHGFHVFMGTIGILISLIRLTLNHFTDKQHIGFLSALWYWHFVDVVWIFLYISVYLWGSLRTTTDYDFESIEFVDFYLKKYPAPEFKANVYPF